MAALTAAFMATAAPGVSYAEKVGKRAGLTVMGLTADQRLIRFPARRPDRVTDLGAIFGLQAPDTMIVGMDFRVQDGQLYGVGDGGGIYTIDTDTATATLVSQLTAVLSGVFFGVDFNPAADRLRVISDDGQNLRHNVNAGGVTAVDAALNYTAGATATGITGAAYTNNDLDTNTGTTLFDIDSSLNQVAVQSPPNNGSLVAAGSLTVDPDTAVGFDIYTTILKNGETTTNQAFASLVVDGVSGFYRVNFLTGKASLVGTFDEPVIDIAIPLNQ
ncbi:MAG: DUF4394 domain-containing protein [Methylococcaceae bacterium]|nr:DUF4394 domain-containing protein [Methylococcaceae bacterium]